LPSLAGQLSGIRAGAQYRFTGGLQVAMDLEYDRNQFDGPHPLFLIERRDRRSKAQIQLSHSQWNWRGFAPVLRLQLERQKSNIIVNDFKNIGASIGATRRF
ncbi:surface lipoprotein assembly modifier, partial [Saccharopolyspora hordei]|uniref:surface lipoprotein assembly modifier n=1 Tax=Saccharopolyspora hordei TaxID=1838 RepID=UPI0035EE0A98